MLRSLLAALGLAALLAACAEDQPPPVADQPIAKVPVKVGAKDFAEQEILAHLIVELLNGTGDFEASVVGPFPGTASIHKALANGEIDTYVEYSGTANEAILGLEPLADAKLDRSRLRKFYEEKFKANWLYPLGFENEFAFVVRTDGPLGQARHFTDLARKAIELNAGMSAEFAARPDGYPLLQEKYGMVFHDIQNLAGPEAYQALDDGTVATIVAFSTDGELAEARYRMLDDNLHAMPRYDAVPVLRYEAEALSPGLKEVLVNLGGKISVDTMRKLNAEATAGQSAGEIARAFVEKNREYLLKATSLPAEPEAVDLAPAESYPATPVKTGPGAAPPLAPAESTPPAQP